MARKTKPLLKSSKPLATLLGICLALVALSSAAQSKYYRYINKEGIKVISTAIPPEYAQKGYEVITKTGQVLQVVKPAPEPENLQAELEKRARIRALTTEYESLTRRYSSPNDIFAARDRRLAHLNATISILRNNIASLNKQTEDLVSKAADSERAGREVSKQILSSMEQVKAELATSQANLKAREEEQTAINNEYQREVDLFNLGPVEFASRPIQPSATPTP